MRSRDRAYSPHPALSPSDGERVAEGRVRGKRNDHMTLVPENYFDVAWLVSVLEGRRQVQSIATPRDACAETEWRSRRTGGATTRPRSSSSVRVPAPP